MLAENHGVDSELWFPNPTDPHVVELRSAAPVCLETAELLAASQLVRARSLDPKRVIISTHGAWRFPTRLAHKLGKLGFRWIYTPHGMLEPWSLRQKQLKKWLYWTLREGPLARRADAVRATSVPEEENLKRLFSNVALIPHGVEMPDPSSAAASEGESGDGVTRILFMGRLHSKKGALALARAWTRSRLQANPAFELIIVGNDAGELQPLTAFLKQNPSNIQLRAPVYGIEKQQLFERCKVFALPSKSEGFPYALLEGMAAKLIPLISDGCNLPEAFAEGIAIRTTPDEVDIVASLNSLLEFSPDDLEHRRRATRDFIRTRFSLEAIAERQAQVYRSLLRGQASISANA